MRKPSVQINVYVPTKQVKLTWTRAAKRANISLSRWIQQAAEREIEREKVKE